jgi:hypothetical protein
VHVKPPVYNERKTGGMMDIGKLLVYLFLLAMFVGGVILIARAMIKSGEISDQARRKEEIFERIMREGTYEQKMIAMQYKQTKQLEALKGLVLFDIFFR